MRILIVTASKDLRADGTAHALLENLRRQRHVAEHYLLRKNTAKVLAPYDAVVIVATLRRGLPRLTKKFVDQNYSEILLKPLYLALHAPLLSERFMNQMSKQLSGELLQHAQTLNLGYEFDEAELGLLDRLRLPNAAVSIPEKQSNLYRLVDILSEKQVELDQVAN